MFYFKGKKITIDTITEEDLEQIEQYIDRLEEIRKKYDLYKWRGPAADILEY